MSVVELGIDAQVLGGFSEALIDSRGGAVDDHQARTVASGQAIDDLLGKGRADPTPGAGDDDSHGMQPKDDAASFQLCSRVHHGIISGPMVEVYPSHSPANRGIAVKRDMELIRKMILQVEGSPSGMAEGNDGLDG